MAIILKEESYAVMAACFEVYKEKGPGFLEAVYQECLEIEFAARDVPFAAHPDLELTYKGKRLAQKYVPDFVCFDSIVLEIKAASKLAPEHEAQMHNYLKATGMRLGILVNFGHYPGVEWKRIVR